MTRCPEPGCRFTTFANPKRALAVHFRLSHTDQRQPKGRVGIVLSHRSLRERLADGEIWPNPS